MKKFLILFLVVASGAFAQESPLFTKGFQVWREFKAQGTEDNLTPEEHDEGGFFLGVIGGAVHALREIHDPVALPFHDWNLDRVVDLVYNHLIKHPELLKEDYFFIVKKSLQENSPSDH